MTNAIGTQAINTATFSGELQAAGLILPIPGFSWGSYGLDLPLPSTLTTAQVALIQQVYQAHDPTKTLPPLPDWTGFLQWIAATFTPARMTALSNAYSPFLGYCQFGNAAAVQWCLTDAKTNAAIVGGALTATEYSQFKTANTTYHLGMTLHE